MDKPIKIIHKYKNNNRKIQYNVLIFIGNIVNDSVIKVLEKIKDKNLFEALTELNINDIKIITKEYGESWYKFFFVDKHIQHTINNIIKPNENKINELLEKYNQEWYNNNIINYNEISNISYNYQEIFKINNEQKLKNIKANIITTKYENDFKLIGGNDDEDDYDDDILEYAGNEDNDNENDNSIDKYNINELENIKQEDYNENISEINKYISDVIEKIDIVNTKNEITKWDDSKDNILYDEQLINVFSKVYIYNQYICLDDTIKTIKNKICAGYEKSKKFNKINPYYIPSRLYLWGEYSFIDLYNNKKNEKIILEYKWINSTELLDIDIEPNNIITNNELYMIDIYNELGLDYNITEDLFKNLYDTYIRIYFYKISQDELKNIIDYLNENENKVIEDNRIGLIYKKIYSDLLIDNEILKIVEELKKTPSLYDNIFKDNYITQSIININITHQNFNNSLKIDLYRIFDNYIVNEKFPFIQYHTSDGKLIFKHHSVDIKYDKNIILSKWFENSPYGISFKILNNNKYTAINMNENGIIDYKSQWKEEDKAVIENIYDSYELIRDLIKKINSENLKLKLEIPVNNKFKFAFINTIQQFVLPKNFLISHNDLSDFARFFYPYVAVVVEPRKRQSSNLKKSLVSKYGTYLRYKRISNYDSEINIEKRIIYFLRNYESNIKLLSLEISKQFNITETQASNKVNDIISKYPNIKKSRNILKMYDKLPKYKSPGVGIDIQGKNKDNYKIRISGARSKLQLNDIIQFMNILIYLYIETYHYKKPEKQFLKNKLKYLINIAKRRNKVEDIIEHTAISQNIKDITKQDKNRLAYKPEKGQNQWTRNCQNSGDNKKRRPLIYIDKNIEDLIKNGYNLNEKTNTYEKVVNVKGKSITLRAAKIDNYDEQGNNIFYTCGPEENGQYMYVGFLSRSANPYGLCMPCCFKKDQALSKNVDKKNFYLRCLGKITNEIKSSQIKGEKIYILQNTNKINDFRYAFLPDYLDIYLNCMLNNTKNIINNFLISSPGWFFKYGTKQDDDILLTAIADAIDMTPDQIKKKISNSLLNESNAESIFMSLNNGDIKTRFKTIKCY